MIPLSVILVYASWVIPIALFLQLMSIHEVFEGSTLRSNRFSDLWRIQLFSYAGGLIRLAVTQTVLEKKNIYNQLRKATAIVGYT